MSQIDKEKATKNLKDVLDKMKDADVKMLHEYHKIFKKEVSFFKRSWAAAWLFSYYNQKEKPSERNDNSLRRVDKPVKKGQSAEADVRLEKTPEATDERNPPVFIPEEESKRLFISIGKNRRLFPREIITLIMSKTSSAREDIGIIRILDNYSFVQVRDTKADEIIETLNGHRFRGRTLAVNFAKPKSSEGEAEAE